MALKGEVLKKRASFKTGLVSFPGKTFLIGEYAVLQGAPAILLNTKPKFEFFVTLSEKHNLTKLFHPQSPAGKWLKLHPETAGSYHVKYKDPYKGKGGFGFSSAQFNLMYWLSRNSVIKQEAEEVSRLWRSYRSLDFPAGLKPSGADVVSQWMGGVSVFSFSPAFKARFLTWPFSDLDFFLIRIGESFSTHKHLNCLLGKEFFDLFPLAEKALSCLGTADSAGFVSAVEGYSAGLIKKGLAGKNALQFLSRMRKAKRIITAKACGAMGAETAAVFFDPKDKKQVRDFLRKETVLAHSSDLTCGITVRPTT